MLARRTDKSPGKQIRQRGMMLPERNHASQQVGPAEQGTIRWRGTPNDDVIPAARRRVSAVVGEFLGGEAILARLFEHNRVDPFEFSPVLRRRKINLDDAR